MKNGVGVSKDELYEAVSGNGNCIGEVEHLQVRARDSYSGKELMRNAPRKRMGDDLRCRLTSETSQCGAWLEIIMGKPFALLNYFCEKYLCLFVSYLKCERIKLFRGKCH